MERQVKFADYQEQTADDHNNLQDFARQSIDNVVRDAVSAGRRFAGFNVSKTGQVEVTVISGRVYQLGEVFARRTPLVQSMASYTAAAAKRIVALSAYGNENDTDNSVRDYLVDVDTGATEPRAVSMTSSRDAQLVFTAGAEAADPVAPPLPATHVVIAYILMDATQVVSVTMQNQNLVASTDDLDERTDDLESFKARIEPRVNSLASDLASLANQVASGALQRDMSNVFLDLARVKAQLKFPNNASNYGTDYYLSTASSDAANSAGLGYDAQVEEGLRFPFANQDEFEISLFSANDPNASYVNGLLLPKFSDELKISTGEYNSEIGISQYGFQTYEVKQGYISRTRLRYGNWYWPGIGYYWWNTYGQPTNLTALYTPAVAYWGTVVSYVYNANYWYLYAYRGTYWWYDTWQEPYMYVATVDHNITGAQVAQTFLVSNDMWATKIGFYVTSKGAAEDIHIALCEVQSGMPNIEKCVQKITYPHASIVNGWNRPSITPTFMQKGKRYALVFISNANHKVGMASGQSYLDGTFFYSTDQIYYQGDLTKDMMIEVWGASFSAAQVAIEFAPINLDGGLRNIDILTEQFAPASTELVYEIRPNGSGEWVALASDLGTALNSAPPLCQFRARFVGTRDMHPGLKLTGSRVSVSRPKTAFKHVSDLKNVTATTQIIVKAVVENYDATPHDFEVKLRIGAGDEIADSAVVKLLDLAAKRYEITYTFTPTSTTQFRIMCIGATNSAANTFQVVETSFYTL